MEKGKEESKDRYEKLTYYVQVVKETEKALLVTDGVVKSWVPKSLITYNEDLDDYNGTEVTMPRWLAEDKELE